MLLLTVIACLIIGLNIYFVFFIVAKKDAILKDILKIYLMLKNKLEDKKSKKKLIRLLNSNVLRLSRFEKFEMQFIEKSNIKAIVPFASVYVLFAFQSGIFILAFGKMISIFKFVPSAVVMSLFLACLPLLVLEIMAKFYSNKIREVLGDFVSCVGRWLAVKEDLFFAIGKSAEGMREPMKKYLTELCMQVQMGVPPEEALDLISYKIDNDLFKDFVVNVKANIKSRGDICKLVSVMEKQFYDVQHEFKQRKISMFSDKIIIYIIASAVILIAFYLLTMVEGARNFYAGTAIGKIIMFVFCCFFCIGTLVFGKMSKYEG